MATDPKVGLVLNAAPAGALRLGFGCAGLAGGRYRAQSLRLLETALDCGVTYFDVARMYGEGTAENVLGEALRGRRERLFITSKAGILPPPRSLPVRVARRASLYLSRMPGVGGRLRRPTPQPRLGVFAQGELRRSVETSLRQLGTDYLDALLLHELTPDEEARHGAYATASALVREGKIRTFGIATGIEATLGLLDVQPAPPIIQVPNSVWARNLERLPPGQGALTVTHSLLSRRFAELSARLARDEALARRLGAASDVDPHDVAAFAQVLLAHALRVNPDGVVLFSSSQPERIRANVQAIVDHLVRRDQIEGLAGELARLDTR